VEKKATETNEPGKIIIVDTKELGLDLSNAVKYIVRSSDKERAQQVKELQKAVKHIQKKIQKLTE